jgi:hypothetical protein
MQPKRKNDIGRIRTCAHKVQWIFADCIELLAIHRLNHSATMSLL